MTKKKAEKKVSKPEVVEENVEESSTVELVEATKQEVSVVPVMDEELQERLQGAAEALESFDDIKLPIIRLTEEGFELREGDDCVEEFVGTIIYTKQSNAYYSKRYKPGDSSPPDCFSADGKTPDQSSESIQHKECKTCPMNQFGSDKTGGDGKACKNTRPTFILVDNPEDPDMLPVMPRVLRVAPTSLALVRNYITNVAADFGNYYGIKTKFSIFKKEDGQAYYNIRFKTARRLTPQERVNLKAVRGQWLGYMQTGMFGMDLEAEPVNVTPEAPSEGGDKEVEF